MNPSERTKKVAEASRLCSLHQLRRDAAATFNYFNTEAEVSKSQGAYLPHWHQDGVLYFVTFRLADSLPQEKLTVFTEEKANWLKQHPEPHTPEEKAEYHKIFPQRLQEWLDLGYGSLILSDEEANRIVHDAITHFEGQRYKLDEFVVAANHVHVLVAPRQDHQLTDILHSWKSFTAKKLLKLSVARELTTAPSVWQKESWDHMVRSAASLDKFREYIRAHKTGG